MVRYERILYIIVGVTSYFTIILYLSAIPFSLFFPLTFSRRLDFSMQRYSSRPASSTAMLTARGFARQPSQIEDVLSVPPPRTSADWVFREIPRPFACLSVLSLLSDLHVKSLPARKAEKLPKRGKRKTMFNLTFMYYAYKC